MTQTLEERLRRVEEELGINDGYIEIHGRDFDADTLEVYERSEWPDEKLENGGMKYFATHDGDRHGGCWRTDKNDGVNMDVGEWGLWVPEWEMPDDVLDEYLVTPEEDEWVYVAGVHWDADTFRIVDSDVVCEGKASDYCLLAEETKEGSRWNPQRSHDWDGTETQGWWVNRGSIPDDMFEEYYDDLTEIEGPFTTETCDEIPSELRDLVSGYDDIQPAGDEYCGDYRLVFEDRGVESRRLVALDDSDRFTIGYVEWGDKTPTERPTILVQDNGE